MGNEDKISDLKNGSVNHTDLRRHKIFKKTIRNALALVDRIKGDDDELSFRLRVQEGARETSYSDDPDGLEDFFLAFEREVKDASFRVEVRKKITLRVSYYRYSDYSRSIVTVDDAPKSLLYETLQIFEDACDRDHEAFPEDEEQKASPIVFIGHGRSQMWRDLKDHLKDQHTIEVVAYETGTRAGHTIRDVLEDMSGKSNMAFLVLTAEDQMAGNEFQARPNVIHETGLFQGKLGFSRAIVLLEEGCEEFSNLAGIQQLRFSKGNIREVFGDVVATIKREFP